MKVTLELELGNAAFEDDMARELCRVFSTGPGKVMRQMERDPATVCDAPEADDKLFDSNGNTVGMVKVIEWQG